MPWELIRDWLLFASVVLGGGLALAPAPREDLSATEAWCIGIALAVGLLAGAVFAVYVSGLGHRWIATGYLIIGTAMLVRRRQMARLWGDEFVREIVLTWSLVSAGALALLAVVFSFSGGAWMIDWEEHYQRSRLLLHLRAEDAEFRRFFTFTARPPLANLADAALLWATDASFARHQIFMLLLNSLAFVPVAMFARTFGGGRAAAAAAAVGVLLNPLFLQNSTYPWTKLLTVFFVLAGLHVLFARGQSRRRVVLGFALLTMGMLTHYSACVWFLVFGAGWLLHERRRWPDPAFRRTALAAGGAATAVFSPWLIYALVHYGPADTFGSNSTYREAASLTLAQNLLNTVPKVWHNLVPPLLRGDPTPVLDQANRWTLLRDEMFCSYQANLFAGAGLFSLVVLAVIVRRPAWRPRLLFGRIWAWGVPGVIVLGSAALGHLDPLGAAHLCLQPLILLGVALAAARLPRLFTREAPDWFGPGLLIAAGIDFVFGIALHYAGCAMQLNRGADTGLLAYAAGLSRVAQFNLARKIAGGQDFFADISGLPWWGGLILLLALIALLILRARRLARASG